MNKIATIYIYIGLIMERTELSSATTTKSVYIHFLHTKICKCLEVLLIVLVCA